MMFDGQYLIDVLNEQLQAVKIECDKKDTKIAQLK